MIEAERCRDDIDRGDHPARAIIPVGRRAREAVAGQVEGDDAVIAAQPLGQRLRSEEHTSELQSLMRLSYAVFCLKKKKRHPHTTPNYLSHQCPDTHITQYTP